MDPDLCSSLNIHDYIWAVSINVSPGFPPGFVPCTWWLHSLKTQFIHADLQQFIAETQMISEKRYLCIITASHYNNSFE